jgi:hypothetical protein
MWQDLLLDRDVAWADLRSALAYALDTQEDGISIVQTIEEATANSPITAEVSKTKGDFITRVSLYLRKELEPNTYEVVSRLVARLGARALVSDHSDNPYTMLLFEAGHVPKKVTLDVESLDQYEEYHVAKL